MTAALKSEIDVQRFNLHELHVAANGELINQFGEQFNVIAYSRFKYGQADIGRHYGIALAKQFMLNFPQICVSPNKVVVSGPSYKYLSTASHGVVYHFCNSLNSYRVKHGLEPVQELHSIRSTVGSDTYAMGDATLRATHLAKSKYHVDTELVQGSHFVFIDDVNVTGATEERTLLRTIPCQPQSIHCLHVAAIDPAYANANAAIENAMNKSVALSLDYIRSLIIADNFRLNTRVFRSILEWPNPDELQDFLTNLRDSLLLEMHAAIVGGTVEMYRRFPKSTLLLEMELVRRNLILEVN